MEAYLAGMIEGILLRKEPVIAEIIEKM